MFHNFSTMKQMTQSPTTMMCCFNMIIYYDFHVVHISLPTLTIIVLTSAADLPSCTHVVVKCPHVVVKCPHMMVVKCPQVVVKCPHVVVEGNAS